MKPGTRVICVYSHFHPQLRQIANALPVKGRTYVVRELVPARGSLAFRITLEGVENPRFRMPGKNGWVLKELAFEPYKFIPADEEEEACAWKKCRVGFYKTCNN